MLRFILYCDLPTMNCSACDINRELSSFADSFVQVTDSLWFFKYPDRFDGSCLKKEEHLFYEHFEKFTNDDSVIFLEVLRDDDYYIFPDHVCAFLQED